MNQICKTNVISGVRCLAVNEPITLTSDEWDNLICANARFSCPKICKWKRHSQPGKYPFIGTLLFSFFV